MKRAKIGDRVSVAEALNDGLAGEYYVEDVSPSGKNLFLSKFKGHKWSVCMGVGRCTVIYGKDKGHDGETKP